MIVNAIGTSSTRTLLATIFGCCRTRACYVVGQVLRFWAILTASRLIQSCVWRATCVNTDGSDLWNSMTMLNRRMTYGCIFVMCCSDSSAKSRRLWMDDTFAVCNWSVPRATTRKKGRLRAMADVLNNRCDLWCTCVVTIVWMAFACELKIIMKNYVFVINYFITKITKITKCLTKISITSII